MKKLVQLKNKESENLDPINLNYEKRIKKLEDNAYSTEEQVVGTWVDGKPVYKKVYTTYIQQTDSNFRYLIIDTDITKETIDLYGSLNIAGTLLTFPTPDIGYGIIGGINKNGSGQLYITLSNKDVAISNFKCVLLYTKTTD
ncbi:MAG: hypothetical protein J6K45_04255 [Clostridia bacterium]|nr:hypothetical protein [Clostridia bacterium]